MCVCVRVMCLLCVWARRAFCVLAYFVCVHVCVNCVIRLVCIVCLCVVSVFVWGEIVMGVHFGVSGLGSGQGAAGARAPASKHGNDAASASKVPVSYVYADVNHAYG